MYQKRAQVIYLGDVFCFPFFGYHYFIYRSHPSEYIYHNIYVNIYGKIQIEIRVPMFCLKHFICHWHAMYLYSTNQSRTHTDTPYHTPEQFEILWLDCAPCDVLILEQKKKGKYNDDIDWLLIRIRVTKCSLILLQLKCIFQFLIYSFRSLIQQNHCAQIHTMQTIDWSYPNIVHTDALPIDIANISYIIIYLYKMNKKPWMPLPCHTSLTDLCQPL